MSVVDYLVRNAKNDHKDKSQNLYYDHVVLTRSQLFDKVRFWPVPACRDRLVTTLSELSLAAVLVPFRHQDCPDLWVVERDRVVKNVACSYNTMMLTLETFCRRRNYVQAAYVVAVLKLRDRLPLARLTLLLEKQGVPRPVILRVLIMRDRVRQKGHAKSRSV